MTALNLPRAVVTKRGACRPIPKNGLPYSAPNDFYSVDAEQATKPNGVDASAASVISNPNEVAASVASVIDAPINVDAIDSSDIVAPNGISANAESNVNAPNDVDAINSNAVNAPNDVNAKASSDIDAPNVITQNAYSYAPPFPLKNPRILYETVTEGATATATSGTNPTYAITPNTWERWIFDGTQSLTVEFNEDKLIDSVGLGAVQLTGKTILVEYSTSTTGAFVTMQTQAGKDGAMLFLTDGYTGFEGFTARRIRITATGSGAGSIGVIYAGVALQMQQSVYGSVSPMTLSRTTQYENSRTESGEWIGRSIKSKGLTGNLKFDKLFEDWYREYFDPFVSAARYKPFFYAWRPDKFPDEVAYCWTTGDIKPSNNGGGSERMSVSFSVEGHS